MTLDILSIYDLVTQAATSNGEKYIDSFHKRYSKDTISTLSKNIVSHLKDISTAIAPFSYNNSHLFRRHMADVGNAFFSKHVPFFLENKKCQDTISERRVIKLILGASLETITKEELSKVEKKLADISTKKHYTHLTKKLLSFAKYIDSLSNKVFAAENQENNAYYISFLLVELFFSNIPEKLFNTIHKEKITTIDLNDQSIAPLTTNTTDNNLKEVLRYAIKQTTKDATKTIYFIASHEARRNDLIQKITRIDTEIEKMSTTITPFTEYTQKRFHRWIRRGIANLLLITPTTKRISLSISKKRVLAIVSAHITTLCSAAGISEEQEKELIQSSTFQKSILALQCAFELFGKALEKLYHLIPEESTVTHEEKVHFINKLVQGIFNPIQTTTTTPVSPIQTSPENVPPATVQDKPSKELLRPISFKFVDAPKTTSYAPAPFTIRRI